MSAEFEGRRVVVTGGTGQLGEGVVGQLLDGGAEVVIPVFHMRELESFQFADHERVSLAEEVDLTDEAAVGDFYGSQDGLWASVHLAGGFAMGPLTDVTLDDFQRMWRMNVQTAFLCCREAVRAIRRAGGDGGRLVNVAARPALVPTGGMVAYTTSKGAVAAMTQALSEELAPEGIWVNAVVPSTIDTPQNREGMPNADFDRWPKPDAIGRTVAFLASPANAVTRGALVPVYGRS